MSRVKKDSFRLNPLDLGVQLVLAGIVFVVLSLLRLAVAGASHGSTVRTLSGVGLVLAFGFISSLVTELRALDRLKSEFLSTVSHELRTPLTSIGGYARLLLDGDAGPLTETQAEFLGIIETNVARLGGMINDLLDVEKLESGRMRVEFQPRELRSVLQECVGTLQVLAGRKGLGLALEILPPSDVATELGPVPGDRDQLVRIFMNLISNAIKYTCSGSVRVEASQTELDVTVRVRDTGIGMSPEERKRLFRKFYRAPSGARSGEGGTGLGLVITRGLVEAHQGRIEVESEPGRGTVFTVTLPRVSQNERERSGVGRDQVAGLGSPDDRGRRVLIADPETDQRILIKRALIQKGFLVDDVPSGRQLIRRIEQEDYDLVLVELGLGDLSGLDALRLIRRDPRWADLPVFMMLDEAANPPSREILASCGADQFVGKYRGIGGVVDAVTSFFE